MQMTLTALPGIPLVQPGDDLAGLILAGLERADIDLRSGDVLAVAQKIVSKAEGRLVDLAQVTPSAEARRLGAEADKDPRLVELILSEAEAVLRVRPGLLIVEHRMGFVCANAGIDHSNVEGPDQVLLLPRNPDGSAAELREAVRAGTAVETGILIIDSHGRAWRNGTAGVAIGVSGFPSLLDLRGVPDLYGDPLQVTQVGLADELAAGASALMGQAGEGLPVVHVRGLPYELREGSLDELLRPKEEDLFR
jgi:coenzyme F420-0:L-glutamate ligase/coenzyme F420-1:gamma-L-glutamate ligase